MKIKIKKLHPDAQIPKYAHGPEQDAGMDLYAAEDIVLQPGVPTAVGTGLALELPPGYEAQIRPRSGLALKHGITVLNSPGTIDPSYRGEVKVILLLASKYKLDTHLALTGTTKTLSNRDPFMIWAGDRIAQMVIAKYEPVEYVEGDELSETERGAGGFGSTGIRDEQTQETPVV